jgi:membrane protease YdiL (CAAX protease family)
MTMKSRRRILSYIILILLGGVLVFLGNTGSIDDFWSGMGSGLLAVSVLQLLRMYRLGKDEAYREKMEIEIKDERNAFLRLKAWGWAGYLFILLAAVATIVLKVMGQDLLSMAASWAVCLLLVLYWVSYLILRRKY